MCNLLVNHPLSYSHFHMQTMKCELNKGKKNKKYVCSSTTSTASMMTFSIWLFTAWLTNNQVTFHLPVGCLIGVLTSKG